MNVYRERPDCRRAFPVAAPAFVAFADAGRQRVDEWSRIGFLVTAMPDALMRSETVPISFVLDFQGYEIGTHVSARRVPLLPSDPADAFRFEFVDLPQRTEDLIELLIDDIVRGRITPAGEALLRIDTPADPISTTPDGPVIDAGPKRRRAHIRGAAMTLFYLAVGAGLFAYIGILVYANVVRMEVHTAVVSRPMEVVEMPVDGILQHVALGPGERVAAGTIVATLRDPKLDADIDAQRIVLAAADKAVERLERQLEVKSRQLDDYRMLNRTEHEAAVAELAARRKELEAAALHKSRSEALAAKKLTPLRSLDDARAAFALAKARVRAAELSVERTEALRSAANSRHHNGREFIIDVDLLRLELDEAMARREEAAARLAVLLGKRAEHTLRAPWPGKVSDVMREPGARVLRGEPLLALERAAEPVVEAFLNQEEVLEVALGDTADIYFPALDVTFEGRVMSVDRTTGFVDEQRSQYTWRGPQDRSARVVLALPPSADAVPSGLPAITLFNRRNRGAVRGTAFAGTDLPGIAATPDATLAATPARAGENPGGPAQPTDTAQADGSAAREAAGPARIDMPRADADRDV